MPRSTERWMQRLVEMVPQIRGMYDEHCDDYDALLPHVFLGDVARYVAQRVMNADSEGLHRGSRDAAFAILDVLEEAVAARDPEVLELVSVSFLDNIDWDCPEGRSIRSAMGPELRKEMLRREGQ